MFKNNKKNYLNIDYYWCSKYKYNCRTKFLHWHKIRHKNKAQRKWQL